MRSTCTRARGLVSLRDGPRYPTARREHLIIISRERAELKSARVDGRGNAGVIVME